MALRPPITAVLAVLALVLPLLGCGDSLGPGENCSDDEDNDGDGSIERIAENMLPQHLTFAMSSA
jgi:hypothetical protein